MLPKGHVIGTGGTISSVGATTIDYLSYPLSGKRVNSKELLSLIVDEKTDFNLTFSDFDPVSSTENGPPFWGRLLAEISGVQNQIDGIVITHGTGTLEETAFAIDLFSSADVPIVFTGAQRPNGTLSSDVAYNFWSALKVASTIDARGRGVLVVIDGGIHTAADVTKISNFGLNAFQSEPAGEVGRVEGASLVFRRTSPPRHPALEWRSGAEWPRVEIVMSYAGADGAQIRAALASGAAGIVVAGLAPGYATPEQRRELNQAREAGIPIVMSSRATIGPTAALSQNAVAGLIGSRCLNPAKSRVLLAACIMNEFNLSEIDMLFSRYA
ncbi:asparaginase [Ruegeria arenilitoris]|uniref:asparaginase n=1 Tax=Ruegeria arenilitoris TaxID=1173585 RepID=UPI00147D8BC7|nr:asparaginase [Ruegeria arenilitoris]